MRADLQGPALEPALAFRRNRLTHDSETARPRVRARRQIGEGARSIIVTNPAHVRTRRITRLERAVTKGSPMKRTTLYATLTAALLVSATAWGISAAVDSPRSLMAPSDYNAAKSVIESDTRAAIGRCRDDDSQARELCKAQARADERVRKAELEARYRGTVAAAENVKIERAKARYEVARVKCGSEHGEHKLSCMRSAREGKSRELTEAKVASAT
jgi:hypothetical protein